MAPKNHSREDFEHEIGTMDAKLHEFRGDAVKIKSLHMQMANTDNIEFRPQHKIETLQALLSSGNKQGNHSADTEIDHEHVCVALEAITGYDGAADLNDALKQHSEEPKAIGAANDAYLEALDDAGDKQYEQSLIKLLERAWHGKDKTKKMKSLMGSNDAMLTVGIPGNGKIADSAKTALTAEFTKYEQESLKVMKAERTALSGNKSEIWAVGTQELMVEALQRASRRTRCRRRSCSPSMTPRMRMWTETSARRRARRRRRWTRRRRK